MAKTKLPATCGDVTIIDLGQVDSSNVAFRRKDVVFPVGFKCSRKHISMVDPSAKCMYESEILEEGGKPVFRVTCEHDKDNPVQDTSPDIVWSTILERIGSLTRRSSRAAAAGGNQQEGRGIELFGLANEKVKKLIMELPGAKQLMQKAKSSGGREGRGMAKAEKEGRAERTPRRQDEEDEEDEDEEDDDEEEEDFAVRSRSASRAKKEVKKGRGRKAKVTPYVQPPEMAHLELGEWRCMEEDIEILPAADEDSVAVEDGDKGEDPDRKALLRIWEIAAVTHFLRCFRAPLGLTTLTSEDFLSAFLECSSVMKVIHLRLLLKPNDRKKAPDMADGDAWLELLRKKLREQREYWDHETMSREKTDPLWSEILEEDPMPESIHQYYALSLRQRALITWALCERLLQVDEDGRLASFPNLDWDDADALRMFPACYDSKQNAYWYFEGSNGILFRESRPREGRRVGAPRFEAVATTHEELEEVGEEMIAEGKRKKLPKLASFGRWLCEEEAPKLASKAQARERAKSRQAMLELMPRKRSSRIVVKEEKEKEEAERKRARREAEEAIRSERERKRKEREREDRLREREVAISRQQRMVEREKSSSEDRERRLRKRRRLMQKKAAAELGPQRSSERLQSDSKWWDVGKPVEVFFDGDWWQAVVLQTHKGLVRGEDEIFVSYVGGSEDENEWVRVREGRARPPSDSWDDNESSGEEELSELESSEGSEADASSQGGKESWSPRGSNGTSARNAYDGARNGSGTQYHVESRDDARRSGAMSSQYNAVVQQSSTSVQRRWEAMKPDAMTNGVHEHSHIYGAAQAGRQIAMNGSQGNGQAWQHSNGNHRISGMADSLAGRAMQLPALQAQFQHGASRPLLAPAMLTGQGGLQGNPLTSLPLQNAQGLHNAQQLLQSMQSKPQLPPMLSAMGGQAAPQHMLSQLSAGMVSMPLSGADSRGYWDQARRST